VALPCATQNEVNKEEAENVGEKWLLMLLVKVQICLQHLKQIDVYMDNKILYGPGKAANAGGVAVSALEMSQNSQRLSWTRDEVDKKLHSIMVNIHETCVKYGSEKDFINYAKGANIGGFVKVADAMLAQGLV